MNTDFSTITETYSSQEKCLDLLEELKWGKTPYCPVCDAEHIRVSDAAKRRYVCLHCKEQFSVFTDTIFEGTRLPLTSWFSSIAIILNAKTGMAAKEVSASPVTNYFTQPVTRAET